MQKISAEDFKIAVVDSSHHQPIIAFFTADNCVPCDEVKKVLEKASETYESRLHIAEIDVEDRAFDEILDEYEVNSIPFIKVWQKTNLVAQAGGVIASEQLDDLLEPYVLTEKQHRLFELEKRVELLVSVEQYDEAQELAMQHLNEYGDEEVTLFLLAILLKSGQTEEAERLLAEMPEELKDDERVELVKQTIGEMQVSNVMMS
jgi:putative thioredoxin